jgi:hypothetical protein
VLVHLGSSDYLSRYKIYVTHVQAWRQQFDKLESVDLRYEHQIIVNPDSERVAKAPQITPAAAKAAMAAGVKPAALIHVVRTTKPAVPADASLKQSVGHWEKPSSKPARRKAPRKGMRAKVRANNAAARPAQEKSAKAETTAKFAMKPAASVNSGDGKGKAGVQHFSSKRKPSASIAKSQTQQDRP